MKMEDQALQHVMNVQTQMLQHLTRLQQEQGFISQPNSIQEMPNPFQGTTGPETISSPVAPPSTMPQLSISDPREYATYGAEPYFDEGRHEEAPGVFASQGLIGGTITEMRDFDATRHSKESTSQYFSQQTRGIQEKSAAVLGGSAAGAIGAGAFFVPGLLPALLVGGATALGVGYGTNALIDGSKTSLDYQQLLQNESYRFFNAFESTNELGGIGMGLTDRQEVSKFLRDLAPQKYLDDAEMMQILEGSANNRLLRTVTDVQTFKDKFEDLVDAVKEITITMNQTIEEATEFMGEMERRGIATKDMAFVAARSKVMSSMLGISASEGAQYLLQTSDGVVAGTSLDPTRIMHSTGENIFLAQEIQDWAKENDERLYHLYKNLGGAGSVGSAYEQSARSYMMSSDGTNFLMGFYGAGFTLDDSGNFAIDQGVMSDLLSGQYSMDEMRRMSQTARSDMSPGELFRLQQTAGVTFNQHASNQQVAQLLERNANMVIEQQSQLGNDIDMASALMLTGFVGNYEEATAYAEQIQTAADGEYQRFFQVQTMKEAQDSHAISNSPGIWKRIGFWTQRNIKNPIGDVGQGMSDFTGRWMLEHQKWITGIDDRSMVGGEALKDFSLEGAREMLENLQSVDDLAKGTRSGLEAVADLLDEDNQLSFDIGMFEYYLSKAQQGELSATDVSALNETLDLGEFNWKHRDYWIPNRDRIRSDVINREATGQYDGFTGKIEYFADRAVLGIMDATNWTAEKVGGIFIEGGKSAFEEILLGKTKPIGDMTLKSLEKSQKELAKEREKLNNELVSLFTSGELGDLSDSEKRQLEESLQAGDVDRVKALTSNAQAKEMAERFKQQVSTEGEFSEDSQTYFETSRWAKALATTGTQLGDLMAESGLFEEYEIDSLIGSMRKDGVKMSKKMKKGRTTAEDQMMFSVKSIKDLDDMFEMLPPGQLQEFASFLAHRDQDISIESFYQEGSDQVDKTELRNYVMNHLRDQHVSDIGFRGDKDSKGTSDVSGVADDHVEAMYEFLTAFQTESQMLRDVVEGRRVSNPNTTSLGTRGWGP